MARAESSDEQWERILRGDGALAVAVRLNRRLFGLFPSPWRCKSCNAPFRGPVSGTFRWIGYSPSAKNPTVCARCIERAPTGGAVVPVSVVMADVRGYTRMTEGLSAAQVPEAMNRFYEASSRALSAAEALLGQIEGDLVMGVFVPGLAGRLFRRKAVEGASRHPNAERRELELKGKSARVEAFAIQAR